jgi:hypothetical protein
MPAPERGRVLAGNRIPDRAAGVLPGLGQGQRAHDVDRANLRVGVGANQRSG